MIKLQDCCLDEYILYRLYILYTIYYILYNILPLSTEWNCMCNSKKIAQLWLFVDAYTDLFSFPPFVVNTYAFVSCTGV